MSVLFIAVPVALLLVGSAVAAFLWAVRGGQLDDLETPALRILNEERSSTRRAAAAPSRDREHTPV
jgi:cbb3-type cytochrome oxidase maturation protein